jgi:hypothetical protein
MTTSQGVEALAAEHMRLVGVLESTMIHLGRFRNETNDARAAVEASARALAVPAPPVQPEPPKRIDWQQRCLDAGFKYWRAPDAHGVTCTVEQATALLADLLGVEVEIAHPSASVQPEPEQRPPYSPAQLRRVARDIHAEELKPRWLTLSRAARLLEATADYIDSSSAHQQSMGHQAGPSGSTHAAEAGSSNTFPQQPKGTSTMNTLQPHQQRVVNEKADLDGRLAKLRAFCAAIGGTFDSLPTEEKQRLTRQEELMSELSAVLGERIEAFSV